uniref:Endonuclease/exonuclease/phosphatase domain-containing protein n=1 Tax=Sparus aurata TaxID=8175 RepID=A0A671WJM7_SPAAU
IGQDFIIQRVQRVIDGRILCIDVSWFGSKFRVINVYCPVELQERVAVLRELQPLLLCSKEVILGGDFNCLVNKKDKQTTSTVRLDSSSEILQNIIKDFRLRDAYRSKNPILPGYTWSNGRTHSRIDFLLTSMGLQVVDAGTTPVFFSDHHKIECSVTLKDIIQKGRGSWKLNISLLAR